LGGTLWIWVVNILIYVVGRILLRREVAKDIFEYRRRAVLLLSLLVAIILPIISSLVIYKNYKCSEDPVTVVAVQPNIDSYTGKHGGMSQTEQDKILFGLIEPIMDEDVDYVITPETYTFSFDIDRPQGNTTYRRVMDFLMRYPNTDFILGSLTYRLYTDRSKASEYAVPINKMWYESYNTAMIIDTTGIKNYYHKSKLVPAVEILPYAKYLKFLGPIFDMFGGSANSYVRMPDVVNLVGKEGDMIGAMICYESIYGDYLRRCAMYGADFITVITNDGWWGDTPGYRQHFRYASLRAIETRRDLVHVANTGITGFIDQRGDVVRRTAWWEPVAIKGEVNRNSDVTFFVKNGDIVGRIAVFTFCMILIAIFVRRFKK
jgi:apolipoprotein N-acyltransferase